MSLNEARSYQSIQTERVRRSNEQPQPKRIIRVKSRKITHGETILACLFGIFVSLSLVYIVSFNADIDMLNRDMQRLERVITEQQMINEDLSHQVMEYSNPERILAIAKENGLNIQNTQIRQASQFIE